MATSALKRKYREEGVLGIAIAAMSRVPLINAICIFRPLRLALQRSHLELGKNDVRSSRGMSEVTDDLNAIVQLKNSEELFKKRLSVGHACIVARNGLESLGYVWAHRGGSHKEERYGFELEVQPHQLYYYDMYIRPESRGQGVFEELVRALSELARAEGASELYCIVESQNKRSMAAHKRLGMIAGHACFFLRIGRMEFGRKVPRFG